jgi:hypothetical protein
MGWVDAYSFTVGVGHFVAPFAGAWIETIHQAAAQMFAGFYGGGMVAIFPESSFATLSLVIFLADSARYQLNGRRYGIGLVIVFHQQMNMIGSNRIVQNLQGETVAWENGVGPTS